MGELGEREGGGGYGLCGKVKERRKRRKNGKVSSLPQEFLGRGGRERKTKASKKRMCLCVRVVCEVLGRSGLCGAVQ